MPASAETGALYLANLVQTCACKASINEAFNAIKWHHTVNGVNCLCKQFLVIVMPRSLLQTSVLVNSEKRAHNS